jgi:hypothetical protein
MGTLTGDVAENMKCGCARAFFFFLDLSHSFLLFCETQIARSTSHRVDTQKKNYIFFEVEILWSLKHISNIKSKNKISQILNDIKVSIFLSFFFAKFI